MSKSSYSKTVFLLEKECQKCGFTKSGANLYRVWGDGILQVITARGFPERVNNVAYMREPSVCFSVYSLYSQIPWNPVKMRSRRDLIPELLPALIDPNGTDNEFRGTEMECESTMKYVLPFLDGLQTHQQLAELYDQIDNSQKGEHAGRNASRISTYLLSGNLVKPIAIINAIEKQNWHAYESNVASVQAYDPVIHKKEIEDRLAPLLALRNAIVKQDSAAVWFYLSNAFVDNKKHLEDMGVYVEPVGIHMFDFFPKTQSN